jgi:predicted metal-dependent phosphoesterase TrpH
MAFADLHLHTQFSDGTFSPAELVEHAVEHQLTAISLTDHDTVEGCKPVARECEAAGIEFINGTELTAEFADTEVHLLGYFLDVQNDRLLGELTKFQAIRQERIYEMVQRLNEMGIALDVDEVFALANCKSPGRPHVARAMIKAGLVKNLDDAFERYLKRGRPAWVPKARMSALDSIALIHHAGGLAVMAHPGLNRSDDIIPGLVAAGLDGIECYHSKHTHAMTDRYQNLAREYHLLITGGSDCHGYSKAKPLIGSIKLPYEFVDALRLSIRARRQVAAAAARLFQS